MFKLSKQICNLKNWFNFNKIVIKTSPYKFPSSKMNELLAGTMTKLKTKEYKDLTIVIGNESCDLDSAVCAIVYATFLYWQHETFKCRACTRHNREKNDVMIDDIFVPVLNVHRQDFCLKTEINYFFKQIGITEENLAFRDDFNYESLLTTNSKVVLVDHHVLAKQDMFLAPYVTEIIDHRPLNKAGWSYKEDTRTCIELVGSCATLVTQRIVDLSALMSKHLMFFSTYLECTRMLHATIILDTVNFSKEVNKATPHDEDIILTLETILKPKDFENERKRILDELTAARSDVSNLNASQLLRKDVKIVEDILVPSFPILVKEFLTRTGAINALSDCLKQNNCTTALLLGMDLRNGLKRDVAVYPMSLVKANLLSKYIEEFKTPSLNLSLKEEISDYKYYTQNNLSASRKQYMPILSALLNENK